MIRTACLLVIAAGFCLPACADSYGLVTFDTPSTSNDPNAYATPYATFYGGAVSSYSFESGGSYYATSEGGPGGFGQEISLVLEIAPDFPVREVSFDVDYNGGIASGAMLEISTEGPGLSAYGLAPEGRSHVDLIEPDGIETVYIMDQGITPLSDADFDNFAFNPSLAPVTTTPEPSSLWLAVGGLLFGAAVFRRRLRATYS